MSKLKKMFLGIALLILILFAIAVIPERRSVFKTQHFTILFSKSIDTSRIAELAIALETNYLRIGSNLKTIPAENIETNVYATRWRYIKATGHWSASGNIDGISKLHFLEQAWGEDDGKKVAIHEFAHTITLKLLLDNESKLLQPKVFDRKFSGFPIWLWEAISTYEANQFIDPKTLAYLNNGQYPGLAELNSRISGGKIYSCGFTIIEYILFKFGQDNLIKLIINYGDIQRVFNMSDDQFLRGWHEFVKLKYLK